MEAQHIANYFLAKAHEEQLPITQLKLLKLIYVGYGWVAAVLSRKLFEEDIEAWQHGPVIPSIYHEFKHNGSSPIEGLSVNLDFNNPDSLCTPKIPEDEADVYFVLSFVWDIYKNFSAWSLRNQTHEPGSPWSQVYKPGHSGQVIPFELIKEYFNKKIAETLNAAGRRESATQTA